jgi:nitrate reductase NapD
MSISGLVIHTRPIQTEAVVRKIGAVKGAEIHAATDDGRLVVTVDEPDNAKATDAFVRIQDLDGVLSVSLVYNYFEQPTDEKEAIDGNYQA